MLEPIGTPSARPTSTVKAMSTGIVNAPRAWRRVARWANDPVRTSRPRPWTARSPARTTMLTPTSTSDSAQAVATLKATCNSVKISVVSV